jgi:hypothetical protein
MRRRHILVLLALFVASVCYAQDNAAQEDLTPGPTDSSGAALKGTFPVTLLKGLDSKKMKVGDVVVCQTVAALHMRNGLMVPSGAKVIGHIAQVTARSNGSPDSTLTMAFDQIEYAKGKELPMKGTLQAIGPSLGEGPNTGFAGSNVLMGGHSASGATGTRSGAGGTGRSAGANVDSPGGSSTPGTTMGPQATSAGNPSSTRPVLLATSQGAVGVKNLQLDADGVISSPGKEVKLDNGTQMLIRAEISAPVE